LLLHPIPGYVTGEWTWNYYTTPIWQQADKAVAFMQELAAEAEGAELDAELRQAILDIRDTLNALAKVSLPTWLDRVGDGRDVATGGADKTVSKP
jgi:hypothetical protein